MKILKAISVIAAILCIAGQIHAARAPEDSGGQEVNGQKKGQIEISGNYNELTFFENGKETKKIRVEKNSDDERALFDTAQKQVLQGLGVNSKKELTERKLWPKYNEEISKRVKVVDLATKGSDRVRFVDKDGNVKREIKLGKEVKVKPVKDFIAELGAKIELGRPGKINLRRLAQERANDKIITRINRFGFTNKAKDHLLLVENEGVAGFEGEKEPWGFPVSANIVYMDNNGSELWRTYFREGETVLAIGSDNDAPLISNDGGIVATMTSDSVEGPGRERLHVFDKSGTEIFTYPDNAVSTQAFRPSDYKISPSGRYLCYQVETRNDLKESPITNPGTLMDEESNKSAILEKLKNTQKTVFWDLTNKTTLETEKYLVYEISDEGVAKVGNPWGPGKIKLLDLRPNLK